MNRQIGTEVSSVDLVDFVTGAIGKKQLVALVSHLAWRSTPGESPGVRTNRSLPGL